MFCFVIYRGQEQREKLQEHFWQYINPKVEKRQMSHIQFHSTNITFTLNRYYFSNKCAHQIEQIDL